jgi:hypothetical protein
VRGLTWPDVVGGIIFGRVAIRMIFMDITCARFGSLSDSCRSSGVNDFDRLQKKPKAAPAVKKSSK